MKAHLCNYPGCNKPSSGRYCDAHEAAVKKAREATRLFEGTRRNVSAPYNALYHTARWKALRKAFLAGRPFCAMCGARATVVDHIIPHRGDEALFYSEGNLQALCASCHSAKTLKENGYFNTRGRALRGRPLL